MNHLVWKGIDGTKDVVSFFSGVYPDYITATGHAKKVIKANCIRCHNEMVSRISTDGRDCWSCHRRVNHKLNEFSYAEHVTGEYHETVRNQSYSSPRWR